MASSSSSSPAGIIAPTAIGAALAMAGGALVQTRNNASETKKEIMILRDSIQKISVQAAAAQNCAERSATQFESLSQSAGFFPGALGGSSSSETAATHGAAAALSKIMARLDAIEAKLGLVDSEIWTHSKIEPQGLM